jgi:hypothetical protein
MRPCRFHAVPVRPFSFHVASSVIVSSVKDYCVTALLLRARHLEHSSELDKVVKELASTYKTFLEHRNSENLQWLFSESKNDSPFWAKEGQLLSQADQHWIENFLETNEKIRAKKVAHQIMPSYLEFFKSCGNNDLITKESQNFFQYGGQFNVGDATNSLCWYEHFKDSRDNTRCPIEEIRRALLTLTTKRSDDSSHSAWLFAGQDHTWGGFRQTAMTVALAIANVVRQSAHCIFAWLGLENKDTSKMHVGFVRQFRVLKKSYDHMMSLSNTINATVAGLSKIEGVDFDNRNLNATCKAFLTYHPSCCATANAIISALKQCAGDRLKKHTLVIGDR